VPDPRHAPVIRRDRTNLPSLRRDARGQTTIEYALLCGVIAVASVTMLGNIRAQVVDIFQTVAEALATAPVGDAG
jgi:Flp pilus assembly pilin Flp